MGLRQLPARHKGVQMVFKVVVDPVRCHQRALKPIGKRGACVAQAILAITGHRMFSDVAHPAEQLKPGQER